METLLFAKSRVQKKRVIVIQKEKRPGWLFPFCITMTLVFCTLFFSKSRVLDFFQGHKPTLVFKTRIVGTNWLGECHSGQSVILAKVWFSQIHTCPSGRLLGRLAWTFLWQFLISSCFTESFLPPPMPSTQGLYSIDKISKTGMICFGFFSNIQMILLQSFLYQKSSGINQKKLKNLHYILNYRQFIFWQMIFIYRIIASSNVWY